MHKHTRSDGHAHKRALEPDYASEHGQSRMRDRANARSLELGQAQTHEHDEREQHGHDKQSQAHTSMGKLSMTSASDMGMMSVRHVSAGTMSMRGMSNMSMGMSVDSSTMAMKRKPPGRPPVVPMAVRQILPSKTWGVVVGHLPSRAGLSYGWKPRTLLLTRPGMGVNPSMLMCTRSRIRA